MDQQFDDSFFTISSTSEGQSQNMKSAFESSSSSSWISNRESERGYSSNSTRLEHTLSRASIQGVLSNSSRFSEESAMRRDELRSSDGWQSSPRDTFSNSSVISGSLVKLFRHPLSVEMMDKMLHDPGMIHDPGMRGKLSLSGPLSQFHSTHESVTSDFGNNFCGNHTKNGNQTNNNFGLNSERHRSDDEIVFGSSNNDDSVSCSITTKDSKFESLQDWSAPSNKTRDETEVNHQVFRSERLSSGTFSGTSYGVNTSATLTHASDRDNKSFSSQEAPSIGLNIKPSLLAKSDRKTNFDYNTKMFTTSRFESCDSWMQKRGDSNRVSDDFPAQESLSSSNNWFCLNEKPYVTQSKALGLLDSFNHVHSFDKSFLPKNRNESFCKKREEPISQVAYTLFNGRSQMEQRSNLQATQSLKVHSNRLSSIRSQVASNLSSSKSSVASSRSGFEETWATPQHSSGKPNSFSETMEEDWRNWGSGSRGSQTFACDACNKNFWNQDQFDKHKKQDHSPCPYPGCSFTAHEEAVEQHFANTHARGIHFKFDTPEDIKKWREDRKRKFPTKQNIELKERERLAKESRGELLQTKTFQNCRIKVSTSQSNEKESKLVSDLKTQNQANSGFNNRGGFSSRPPKLTSRQKYLARFMRPEDAAKKPKYIEIKKEESSSDDDSGPEEAPIAKCDPIQTAHDVNVVSSNCEKSAAGEMSKQTEDVKTFESSCAVENFRDRRRARCRKATLLEMLLAPEIRQERNVLLQCMFFIEQNNFLS